MILNPACIKELGDEQSAYTPFFTNFGNIERNYGMSLNMIAQKFIMHDAWIEPVRINSQSEEYDRMC